MKFIKGYAVYNSGYGIDGDYGGSGINWRVIKLSKSSIEL
jgi:hypothetical protein